MSGLYFPLGHFPILNTGRGTRSEILPFAYRSRTFRSDDSSNLLKFLVAIGQIGRDNIQSLDFAWASNIDIQQGWELYPAIEDPALMLPSLHIIRCVRLLGQCKKLRFLRIRFEEDLISTIRPALFKADPGIRALCSIRKIRTVEICGAAEETLDDYPLAKWLRSELQLS